MNFENFVAYIRTAFEDQYVEKGENENRELVSFCSSDIPNKEVFRIKRKSYQLDNTHCKTILLVDFPNKNFLRQTLQWAASAKEFLIDPEIADLYLFIYWREDDSPSLEDCFRIESTEEFCRKYVLRPKEELEAFIQRTFLSTVQGPNQRALGSDPITHAFSQLPKSFDFFMTEEEVEWKKLFLSRLSGNDLIEQILKKKPN